VGQVTQLQLSGNVVLCGWAENWDEPALPLHKGRHHQVRTRLPLQPHTCVRLCPATGEELITGFQLTEIEDKLSGAGKMIGAPALISASVAANGAAKNETFVRVGVVVLIIEIDEGGPEIM